MDSDQPNDDQPTGDELLPEVEAPSAGFILQLFVVPALIVLIVFALWLAFSWLVHRGMDPADLIQGLEGSSVARWQRASELADMLRSERYDELRHSPEAAAKLATILEREIEATGSDGGMDEQAVNLRYFLCRALGEFHVAEGLDALIEAATTNRDPAEELVRRGALQAIAVRASHLAQRDPPVVLDGPELESALSQLANDPSDLVRSETAYALGRIGTPAALERLESMVHDSHTDTRYNAAVALARHGNPAAIDTLAEMLDPAVMDSVRQENNELAQFNKRALIMISALEAVDALVEKKPAADFSPVIETLEYVVSADEAELEQARIRQRLVIRARETLEQLRERPRDAATSPAS